MEGKEGRRGKGSKIRGREGKGAGFGGERKGN